MEFSRYFFIRYKEIVFAVFVHYYSEDVKGKERKKEKLSSKMGRYCYLIVVSTSYSYVNVITQLLRVSQVCSSDMMFVGFIKFKQEMKFEISVGYHFIPALFKRIFLIVFFRYFARFKLQNTYK